MPFLLLLYLMIASMTTSALQHCPRTCVCKWKSGKESVECLAANYTTVPPNLESSTQILDLTGNGIVTLKHREFSRAGLVNLQKIYLVRCRLKSIEKLAFKDLINLIELDLSYNHLATVPSDSFEAIPELRELKLSGNSMIQTIRANAFVSVPNLVRLELSQCRIGVVETGAFNGLQKSLMWLKLDDNKLGKLEAPSFTILQNLRGLELAGNPWNCSCGLRDFREWMLQHNIPYDIPPSCQHPKRLVGKSWKVLELDEFACPPKIVANEEGKSKGEEGGNITISCRIDGVPKPQVKWFLRNKAIANQTDSSFVTNKKVYVVKQEKNSSELTIRKADLQDAGVYTCAAENRAGRAEAVVTLTVTRKSLDMNLTQKALVISVFLGVTVTLLCCLVGVCYVNLRKKRLLKWSSNECRREDNYEKIEMKHRNLNGGVSRESGAASITIAKKNGDYCVVPGADTDHENEEEEESTLEATTPGTSTDQKEQNNRDIISRTCSSTCGTYSKVAATELMPSGGIVVQPAITEPYHQQYRSSVYTTSVSMTRQIPDVVGHSARTRSENSSASDLNELFCTLPRKKDLPRYRSTSDSQSPLLSDSQYGSDSSFARRLSKQSMAGSLANLTCKEDRFVHVDFSTPLLDVRGLESRFNSDKKKYHQPEMTTTTTTLSSSPAPATNPYDYHAAQLEKFLEEYRVLQKQLTKMKETCDSICLERGAATADESSSCTNGGGDADANLNNQLNSPNWNSIQDSVDFKNFESELTKYLMARGPSSTSKNFASGALHN